MGSGSSSTSSGGGRPFAWAAAAVVACVVVNAMPNLRPTSPVGNSVQAAELSYEVSQKARSFGQQVTDFLASWR